MADYKLSLLGFGGVNRALVELIHVKRSELQEKEGIRLTVVAVSDLFLGYAEDPNGLNLESLLALPAAEGALGSLPNGSSKPNNEGAYLHPDANIVSEATFTNPVDGEPAVSFCRGALADGKHVVTTNKGPIAHHYDDLLRLAGDSGAKLGFEGTVMSGTPVLRFVSETLFGAEISGFRGILNGTANYVLGEIEQGASFDTAITDAKDRGYAEADPTADIEGFDVAMKVRILCRSILGRSLKSDELSVQGISGLDETDIRSAYSTGSRWKLIGSASIDDNGNLAATVGPQCLGEGDSLAAISGPINAITFTTDVLDEVTVSGPGAGRIETGYALLADILAIHHELRNA